MCLITYRRLLIDLQCCSVLFFLLIKVYRSSASIHKLHHESHSALQRPSNFKLWFAESMDQAMNAVLNEGMSIRHAAEHYAIPKSTLGDRISGRVLPGSTSGLRWILNDE